MLGLCRQHSLKAAFIALAMTMPGCLNVGGKTTGKKHAATKNFNLVYYTENPFSANPHLATATTQALLPIKLSQGNAQGLNEESLWAIAGCQCTPGFDGTYLRLLVQSRGALPQALVPTIRESIRNKPIFKTLFNNGISSTFSALLNVFVKDEAINREIRKALGAKLKASLPGGTSIADDMQIFFDLYPQPFSGLGEKNAFAIRSMNVSQQASKWALVMSMDNLWGANPAALQPIGYKDHGLQLLATAMSISEWSYAFGLDPTTTGKPYSGLTIDPIAGLRSVVQAFDPRKNTTGSGVITGTYAVSFPTAGSLDLAINVKETWARTGTVVSLDEQARIWSSAGKAYQHLRPSARTPSSQQIFSTAGLLPDDAHLLPLAFLPGVASLLDGPFINTKEYFIRENAVLKDAAEVDASQSASLRSLARLSRALLEWNVALEDTTRDRLPPSVATQLATSKTKLKDSLRLAVQTILDKYVDTQSPTSRLRSIAMIESLSSNVKPDMATVAETLTVLAAADQSIFKAGASQTDFQKKIVGLFHWFAADYLADIAKLGQTTMTTPEAAFWTSAALREFAKYPAQIHQAPWLADALRNVDEGMKKWDAGFPR